MGFRHLLTAFLLLVPTISQAFFVDVKAMGRAGAVVASPQDSLTAAYNPAAPAFICDRWDLGLHWTKEWGRTEIADNETAIVNGKFSSHNSWSNLFIPEFGVSKKICECNMTMGLICYNRNYLKTTYSSANPLFGTSKPGLEYIHQIIAPNCTIKFGCDHALGINIDFHGQRLKVNGFENFANDDDSDSPNNVTNKGYNYSGGIGVTVGWLSQVSDCVRIGLAWSPEVKMSRFRDYRGLVARGGRVDIPQRFLGGFAVEMACRVTFEFDMEHVQYNQITSIKNRLLPAFNKSPAFGEDDSVGLGWRDQMIFRTGLEWLMDEYLALRIGWWHARTPIKSKETVANSFVPSIIEDYVLFGGSWLFCCVNELNFYGGYGFENNLTGRRSVPESLGGGEFNLHERKWMAGISWGRFF